MTCLPRKVPRWSRLINTHLAQTAKAEPRFIPLATVPTQDGKLAAEVLREAHAAGFKGVMIGTQTKGKGGVLDDPALDPFWEAANELGSIVSSHPVFESGDDRVHDYGMANAVGRVTDTMIAVSPHDLCRPLHALPEDEVPGPDRWRGAALRHRAACAPIMRSTKSSAIPMPRWPRCITTPSFRIRARCVISPISSVRIGMMMGSDMPFPIGDLSPLKIVADTKFSDAERASINGGLAQKLFGL